MSELRKDPVVDRWVIIAPERPSRLARAIDPHGRAPSVPAGLCPFCPGNESLTPPEITSVRDGPQWAIRVVPNLFPALRVEVQPDRRDGLFTREAGVGAQEIVIEMPEHDRDFADLSSDEMVAVLWMWSERLRDLSRDLRLVTPLVSRNRGQEAGQTVQHAHSQILVLPVVPLELSVELDASERLYVDRNACVWCETIHAEQDEGARFLFGNQAAVALCPWASRVPFEARILPLAHASSFERESRKTLVAVVEVLRETLRRIDVALERPPCSIVLRTAPLRSDELSGFHWYIDVLPVLGRFAATPTNDCWINPVAPEEAATVLKRLEAK